MTDEVIGPKIEEKSETTDKPTTVENTDNKPEENVRTKVPKIREWDRGKESMYKTQESYLALTSFLNFSSFSKKQVEITITWECIQVTLTSTDFQLCNIT